MIDVHHHWYPILVLDICVATAQLSLQASPLSGRKMRPAQLSQLVFLSTSSCCSSKIEKRAES